MCVRSSFSLLSFFFTRTFCCISSFRAERWEVSACMSVYIDAICRWMLYASTLKLDMQCAYTEFYRNVRHSHRSWKQNKNDNQTNTRLTLCVSVCVRVYVSIHSTIWEGLLADFFFALISHVVCVCVSFQLNYLQKHHPGKKSSIRFHYDRLKTMHVRVDMMAHSKFRKKKSIPLFNSHISNKKIGRLFFSSPSCESLCMWIGWGP